MTTASIGCFCRWGLEDLPTPLPPRTPLLAILYSPGQGGLICSCFGRWGTEPSSAQGSSVPYTPPHHWNATLDSVGHLIYNHFSKTLHAKVTITRFQLTNSVPILGHLPTFLFTSPLYTHLRSSFPWLDSSEEGLWLFVFQYVDILKPDNSRLTSDSHPQVRSKVTVPFHLKRYTNYWQF